MNDTTQEPTLTDLIGPVDWVTPGRLGYIRCPGQHLHTGPDHDRDCRLYLDGAPTIFCLHQSCADVVREATSDLRMALKARGWAPPEITEEARRAARQKHYLRTVAERLRAARNFIFEEYRWPVSEMERSLRGPVRDRSVDVFAVFLRSLFQPDDVVWCGEPHHTGRPSRAVSHFRTVRHWLSDPPGTAGQFICANPLIPGAFRRSKDNIQTLRYFVVECDSASDDASENQDRSGAVFRYLCLTRNWQLRAVVDSGNKSLHGWFDYPGESEAEWAKHVLPALGADPATMRPAQPVRRPGAVRHSNQRVQRLLYLEGWHV